MDDSGKIKIRVDDLMFKSKKKNNCKDYGLNLGFNPLLELIFCLFARIANIVSFS